MRRALTESTGFGIARHLRNALSDIASHTAKRAIMLTAGLFFAGLVLAPRTCPAQYPYHVQWSMADEFRNNHNPWWDYWSTADQTYYHAFDFSALMNEKHWWYWCQQFAGWNEASLPSCGRWWLTSEYLSSCGYFWYQHPGYDAPWWDLPGELAPTVGPRGEQTHFGEPATLDGVFMYPPYPDQLTCMTGPQRILVGFHDNFSLNPDLAFDNITVTVLGENLSIEGDGYRVCRQSNWDQFDALDHVLVAPGQKLTAIWGVPGQVDSISVPLTVDGSWSNVGDLPNLEIRVDADIVCKSLPSVTIEPAIEGKCAGEWVTFRAETSGGTTPHCKYQWYQNSAVIQGATDPVLNVRLPTWAEEGYSSYFHCLVYNSCSYKYSEPSWIYVYAGPCTTYDCTKTTWTEHGPPGKRFGAAAVFDENERQLLVLGGTTYDVTNSSAETWAWDGATWTLRCNYSYDGPIEGATTAFDSVDGYSLLFGGYSTNGGYYSKWLYWWNGYFWNYAKDLPAAGRAWQGMAFDSDRDKLLVFGGQTAPNSYVNDLWEWDFLTNEWTQLTPTGNGACGVPCPRGFVSMAYDPINQVTLLFGGAPYNPETWTLNCQVQPPVWTLVSTTVPNGNGRLGAAMTFDPSRGKIVLFGGDDGDFRGDLWEWNGQAMTWSVVPQGAVTPPPRSDAAFAFDTARNKLVLFGGRTTGGVAINDTWEFSNGVWTQRVISPGMRFDAACASDPEHGQTLVFGGNDNVNFQDTWSWDGNAWTRLSAAFPAGPVTGASMVYDTANHQFLLLGGIQTAFGTEGDPALYTWTGSTWTPITGITGGPPPARAKFAMTYDSHRQTVLVFGGARAGDPTINDLWEWNGATKTWTQWLAEGNSTGPSRRNSCSMAFDAARNQTVLFGGSPPANGETWLLSSPADLNVAPTWTLASTGGISPRYNIAMAFASSLGRVVLFGGDGDGVFLNDLYSWDGGSWSPLKSAPSPPVRSQPAIAFDASRGRLVLYGGQSIGAESISDTWEAKFDASPSAVVASGFNPCPGGTGAFSVQNFGFAPYSYQWQIDTSGAGTWVSYGESPVDLPCGGKSFAAAPQGPATPISVFGCSGLFNIRCIVSDNCGSTTSTVTHLYTCGGDLTCDQMVDDGDFVPFAAAYDILLCTEAGMPQGCPADLNGDGMVDDGDFVGFARAYDELLCP